MSSATLGINGASVSDMFRPVKRAGWFSMIAWANVARRYPSFTEALDLILIKIPSTSNRTYSGRVGCIEAGYRLEVDRVDHTHYVRICLRYRSSFHEGDVSASTSGLESRKLAESHRRQAIYFGTCSTNITRQPSEENAYTRR